MISSDITDAILFYDSGLGGLNVVETIRRSMPLNKVLYIADNAFFPIGRYPEEWVRARCSEVVLSAVHVYRPTLVIIACNTAATAGLDYLQRTLDIPVRGVLPDIGKAFEGSVSKKIAFLSTPSTLTRKSVQNAIARVRRAGEIVTLGSVALVEIAQDKMLGLGVNLDRLRNVLRPVLDSSIYGDLDTIIPACTHFPAIRSEISTVLGTPLSAMVDPFAALLNEMTAYRHNRSSPSPGHSNFQFALTGAHDASRLAKAFKQLRYRQFSFKKQVRADIPHL